MTNRALHLHHHAIFRFAVLLWVAAYAGRASESVTTNQSGSLRVDSGSPVLTTAEQVHWLTPKEAAGGQRVLIRGVITCALPDFEGAVVQDETSGIYIEGWNPSLGGRFCPCSLVGAFTYFSCGPKV